MSVSVHEYCVVSVSVHMYLNVYQREREKALIWGPIVEFRLD